MIRFHSALDHDSRLTTKSFFIVTSFMFGALIFIFTLSHCRIYAWKFALRYYLRHVKHERRHFVDISDHKAVKCDVPVSNRKQLVVRLSLPPALLPPPLTKPRLKTARYDKLAVSRLY